MTRRFHIRTTLAATALMLPVSGCEQAPEIEPLSLGDRPSPEARAGLPELEGRWVLAGISAPLDHRPEEWEDWEGLRGIEIEMQRLDSIAGSVHTANGVRSLFGEVRRDGVLSVVLPDQERVDFLAGEVRSDTVWLSFTNLEFADEFPAGTSFALLREAPSRRFMRLADGRTVPLGAIEAEPETEPEEEPADPDRPEPTPDDPPPAPRPAEPTPRPDPAPQPRPDPTPPVPDPDPAPPPDPDPPPRDPDPPPPDPDPVPPPPDPVPDPPPPDPVPPPDPDPPPV